MKSPNLKNKLNINSVDIKSAIKGVIKFVTHNPQLHNQLFKEEFPLFLQINSFKIPNTKGLVKKLFRVPLATSPLPSDPDICLIVPDVKGIPNKEHEKHLEHYDNILKTKGVTGIKKIMTFHEFRTEYDTFELKNRLADLYDIFLVDGRISGKVVHKCGSIFYKKRKVPLSVKLHIPNLEKHIEQSLKKVFFHINLKSDSHTLQIGHSKMKIKSLIDNVYSVVEFIDKQFPGKMENIRSINVFAHRGSSIPVYVSFKNPNDVKVPTLSNKKPKAYKSFSGELTTMYNVNVVVRPSGQVFVQRTKDKVESSDKNEVETITDAEIIRENKKVDKTEKPKSEEVKKGKKRKISETTEASVETSSKEKKLKKSGKPKSKKSSMVGQYVRAISGGNDKVKKEKLKLKKKIYRENKPTKKTLEKVGGGNAKIAKPKKKKTIIN